MDAQGITRYFEKAKAAARSCKPYFLFPNVIIPIALLTAFIYIFSFLFPFTDDAFIVNNVRPVAALVSGYITELKIKNGDPVKKGQVLFTVFNKPYYYTVKSLRADLREAQTQKERDEKLSENYHNLYVKLNLDNIKYRKGYHIRAVSLITLQNSTQEMQAAKATWEASLKQIEVDEHKIASIIARLKLAEVNLDLTTVRAEANGIIQNLFLTLGAPININQPLFSLVYNDENYIQANFNETDLRNVHKGSKVLIFPRMYLCTKIFHGEVISDYWGANRQLLDPRTQLQNVTNENQWILLPQRLPVLIKITDPDPNYPLRVGSSAYVYIKMA